MNIDRAQSARIDEMIERVLVEYGDTPGARKYLIEHLSYTDKDGATHKFNSVSINHRIRRLWKKRAAELSKRDKNSIKASLLVRFEHTYGKLANVESTLTGVEKVKAHLECARVRNNILRAMSELAENMPEPIEHGDLTEEQAREVFVDSLPNLPMPLLELAVSEWAKRVNVDISAIRRLAIQEAA